MTEVLKKISVDLSRRGNTRLIFARQMDRGSRRVVISLTDCGRPYFVPEGTVATINILRGDGESAAFAAEVTDGGEVELTLPLWALSISGEAKCSVSLYGADCKLSSADFTLDVVGALYLGDELAEDEKASLLSSLLSEVAAFKEDEVARKAAEGTRNVAEEARKAAEDDREEAEEYRVLGESQRNRNESYRFEAEEERARAEEERARAEEARATAESERSRAETERSAAEQRRDEAIESLKTRVDGSLGVFGKLTLKKTDFDSGLTAEAQVVGAGELDMIAFYPESAEDAELSAKAGLFILPNAASGRVIFTAKKLPERDLNFCYFITKGGA